MPREFAPVDDRHGVIEGIQDMQSFEVQPGDHIVPHPGLWLSAPVYGTSTKVLVSQAELTRDSRNLLLNFDKIVLQISFPACFFASRTCVFLDKVRGTAVQQARHPISVLKRPPLNHDPAARKAGAVNLRAEICEIPHSCPTKIAENNSP